MEMICRALLVYCVKHYKGDDKIKSFIWDLITPIKDGGSNQALQNHSGLSAPVPRGRKGKKMKNQMLLPEIKNADWLASCNPEIVLHDESYKKHLKQHCNKVLLRVRMLYYLKAEVLGDAATKALEGVNARDLDVMLPDIDYVEIPVDWWDAEADKSLLLGVFKHGISGTEKEDNNEDKQEVQQEENTKVKENTEEQVDEESSTAQDSPESDKLLWPVASALTARLRRLITVYQRCNRKELSRPEILAPTNHNYWLQDEMVRRVEMDPIMKEMQKRWTRREQADFYRTVSSFGVIYDADKKYFDWTQFRALSRLDKKTDESLEKYFHSFVAMCRNVCRLPLRKDDGSADPSIYLDPITEERAARTLYRIELLRKVREQVLRHPQLNERLKLCRPSLYLPVWWECGKHDRDLLIGTAKHGLSRTDYYIMNDTQLSFLDAYRNYSQHKRSSSENMCCHYQMGSKMYEPATCHLERTFDSTKVETENEIKIEAVEEPIARPDCSPKNGGNFSSRVGEMMTNNHDECSLPDALICMMYDKKSCNSSLLQASTSEQSSLAQESFLGLEEKSEPNDYSLNKTKVDNLSQSEEPVSRDCFLGTSEQEDPLEVQESSLGKPFNSSENHISLSQSTEELRAKVSDEKLAEGSPSTSDGKLKMEDCEVKKENVEDECTCKEDAKNYGRAWMWKAEPADLLDKYPEEEVKSCSISTAREVTQDFHDGRAPTIAQLLQEKTLYSFSEWPKDRVIINRIDNICHSVLKGKWPSSSQQFEAQCMDAITAPAFCNDERKPRKPFEFDGERSDIKPRVSQHLAPLHGRSSAAINGWRETAMELCREQSTASSSAYSINSSTPKVAGIGGLQSSLGMDLSGILQAGLIHPVTGQIVNGSLRREESALRRRRGRRKNVEGMDLVFLKDRGMHAGIVGMREDSSQLSSTHTEGPSPIQSVTTASKMHSEKVMPNKSLLEWLRQQSDCTIDIPTYGGNVLCFHTVASIGENLVEQRVSHIRLLHQKPYVPGQPKALFVLSMSKIPTKCYFFGYMTPTRLHSIYPSASDLSISIGNANLCSHLSFGTTPSPLSFLAWLRNWPVIY
ncbi:hypothetical protein AB205_0157390, partial [Aquarana catesbeiana]